MVEGCLYPAPRARPPKRCCESRVEVIPARCDSGPQLLGIRGRECVVVVRTVVRTARAVGWTPFTFAEREGDSSSSSVAVATRSPAAASHG